MQESFALCSFLKPVLNPSKLAAKQNVDVLLELAKFTSAMQFPFFRAAIVTFIVLARETNEVRR